MRSSRKLLYTPDRVHAMFSQMRDDLHELAVRHASEVAALRAELDHVWDLYARLRAVSLARTQAEAELADLRREREIARARAAERDWNQLLQ